MATIHKPNCPALKASWVHPDVFCICRLIEVEPGVFATPAELFAPCSQPIT